MDVRLTDEHRLLVDTADAIAAAHAPTTPSRLGDAELDGWGDLTAAGLTDLRGPDRAGSGIDVALVAERLAARLSPTPFTGPTLAAELLRLAGGAVDGRATIAVDADLVDLGVALAFDSTGADLAIGIHGDQPVVVAVGRPVPGAADLTRGLHATAGEPRPVGEQLTDADQQRWLALALVMVTADLVGTMDGAIALAVTHARERYQFDRPIGSFQAVQHLLAEAAVSLEAARSASWHAAWAVDALEPAAALDAARIAKAYAARVAPEVGETAVQVLGGIGMTWESNAHAYLRRSLLGAALFGDEAHQLRNLARGGRERAGERGVGG